MRCRKELLKNQRDVTSTSRFPRKGRVDEKDVRKIANTVSTIRSERKGESFKLICNCGRVKDNALYLTGGTVE